MYHQLFIKNGKGQGKGQKAIAFMVRVSASQTRLTGGFEQSVEFGRAAAKTETIY